MRATINKQPNGDRLVRVWLDEREKVAKGDPRLGTEDFTAKVGDPDPEWIIERTWGPVPDALADDGQGYFVSTGEPEMSEADYEAMILREIKLMAEQELADRRTVPDAEPAPSDLLQGKKL